MSVEGLADDVNELAVMCGWETSKWGPYTTKKTNSDGTTTDMWQIHVNENTEQFRLLSRSTNITKIPVVNARIVCFSVPNGTLVTRRNGRVAYHGNCKHGAHLSRLLRMSLEILTTGKVHVWRGPSPDDPSAPNDADELLAIRQGEMDYNTLINWAEKQDAELNLLYNSKQYVVPRAPDQDKINNLTIELIETALSSQ